MATKYLEALRPGDVIRGTVHECPNCKKWFVARSDAQFCSNACRMAEKRKGTEAGQSAIDDFVISHEKTR